MAWTESRMFRQWPNQAFQVSGTGYTGMDSDALLVALFDSSITPDRDAVVGSTGYNTGQWLTSDEVTDATNWQAGGRTLAGKAFSTPSTGVLMFDADDLAGGGTVTLSDANGCLVYDDTISGGTVADQGITYHWFGGAQSVTAGTFTIVWHANGLFRVTV